MSSSQTALDQPKVTLVVKRFELAGIGEMKLCLRHLLECWIVAFWQPTYLHIQGRA